MSLIDLLLNLKIPAWLVLVLAVAAIVAMTYYRHLLARRVKQLEHRLKEEATSTEKHLELLQERHTKRLDALDEVNAALMEFNHAVDHLQRGDAHYADRLKEYHDKARTLSRRYEALLGGEFYRAVLKYTDLGEGILRSSFTLTNDSLKKLEQRGLPTSTLDALRKVVGKQIPVVDTEELVQELDDQVRGDHQGNIFYSSHLSDEFNTMGYHEAKIQFERLKGEILRTLPRLPKTNSGPP